MPKSEETAKASKGKAKLQKFYIDEVRPKETVSTDQVIEIVIKGNLPSPAYTFDHFDVNVRGSIIEITPLAVYHSDIMAAQVLVPFEQVCTVEDLKEGEYQITVKGRVKDVEAAQRVQVKD